MAAVIADAGGGGNNATPKLVRRKDGDYSVITTGSAFSMTSGQTMRCVITTTGGQSGPQTLTVYVNGTSRLTSTAIDDDWVAGQVGLIALSGSASQLDFDNFKVGFDNNGDADIADLGDDIKLSDGFGSTTINLTYDDNGNLTNDGVFDFDYDAWNRLVKAKTADQDNVLIGTYSFDGLNRRIKKVVSNQGVEVVAGDGGDTTVNFYYDRNWRILETRNGSNQTTRQWVFGTQYTDEIVLMDVNGDPTIGNDANPDVNTNGESSNDDHRYFYHQDRNWNVVALTDYGSGVNGNIVERFAYTPYGEFTVHVGLSGGNDLGRIRHTSSVGNIFAHQGLPLDAEKLSYQNRQREYGSVMGCFLQRDPAGYNDGANLYRYADNNPNRHTDPSGLSFGNNNDYKCLGMWRLIGFHVGMNWWWFGAPGGLPPEHYRFHWLDYGDGGDTGTPCRKSNCKGPEPTRTLSMGLSLYSRSEQFPNWYNRYGASSCTYCVLGDGHCWGQRCSNSNGGIHAAWKFCREFCTNSAEFWRPWFGWAMPGWWNNGLQFDNWEGCKQDCCIDCR